MRNIVIYIGLLLIARWRIPLRRKHVVVERAGPFLRRAPQRKSRQWPLTFSLSVQPVVGTDPVPEIDVANATGGENLYITVGNKFCIWGR